MSTKTTIKRIALVAVAALGMGVLSIVPASAGRTLANISNVNSITASTNRTPVAGANGNSTVHTITFQSDSTTGAVTISPYMRLISKPALSAMDDTQTAYVAGAVANKGWQVSSAALTQTTANAAAWTVSGGTAYNTMGADLSLGSANAAGYYAASLYVHARYDVAGTYTWSVFDDTNADGRISGADFSTTFSVVVSGGSSVAAAVATISAVNSTAAVAGTYGSLVKVTLKDAAGNAVAPDQTAGVTLSLSGSAKIAYVNNSASAGTGTSSYTLGAGDFNGSGIAFVNVTNAVQEVAYTTVTSTGFNSFTAPASIGLTFKTITATATNALLTVLASATNPVYVSATSYTYDGLTGSVSFKTNTAAATYDKVTVTDASAKITGLTNAVYDLAVLGSTTATNKGSFSLTFTGATATSTTFSINGGGSAVTLSRDEPVIGGVTVLSADTRLSATGASHSFLVGVVDQYDNAIANKTVTVAIAGRNAALVLSNMVSDASGYVTFTYTDASTSTTSMKDTITFTQGAFSDTASVTYTSVANLGAATVLVVTPNTTSLGVTEQVATSTDIAAGAAGPTATTATLTAKVTDSASVALVGVPVTWTISGTTGAAITSTTKTAYTDATGVATAAAYGWVTGTYTVTATAGTVSDTAPVNFSQKTDTESRNITAVAKGNIVTATVKDRFGNGVYAATVYATRTGAGSFAGSSRANGTTDANGQIEFIVTGGEATVTVSVGADASFGQTDATAGLVSTITATDIFTATAAGDAYTDETGVGASFSAAGNNSATASATAAQDAAEVTAQAAVDAAAEATDAANAATDAANAAAEAADAATAAAQDAADAVAALSAQVSTMMSSLKAQLTALTNLVIKIQKKVKA
jgi:hypothetical protein